MSLPPNRNLFAEYKGNARVFVETGTYRGDGIQAALDADYRLIVSIDIDPAAKEFCKSRFTPEQRTGRIYLHTDDTGTRTGLYDYIKEINEPIVFWLDAHWQMLEGTEPGPNPWPLISELQQIGMHTAKTGLLHTILIDDMLIMQHNITGYNKENIEFQLRNIYCSYKFEYVANPVINNLLIAHT